MGILEGLQGGIWTYHEVFPWREGLCYGKGSRVFVNGNFLLPCESRRLAGFCKVGPTGMQRTQKVSVCALAVHIHLQLLTKAVKPGSRQPTAPGASDPGPRTFLRVFPGFRTGSNPLAPVLWWSKNSHWLSVSWVSLFRTEVVASESSHVELKPPSSEQLS
jgi:hypothetical protein